MKFVFLISTAGSVFQSLFSNKSKNIAYIDSVISDRFCKAIEFAESVGVKTRIINAKNGTEFSDKLNNKFKNRKEIIFISFYTKLFAGEFIESFHGRIVNFHPSILPSFPGKDGFGDTVKSGSCFIGSTIHFVDNGIDTGPPIIQSVYPYNPNIPIEQNRHNIYIQQCNMLEQIMKWFIEDRVFLIENKVIVKNASYKFSEYSPNLEITHRFF